MDTVQFALIKDIAEQCIYTGGESVLRARALYQLKEDRIFEDDENCSFGAKKFGTNVSKLFEFYLHPNPASNEFTVLIDQYNKDMKLELRTITGNLVKHLNLLKGTEKLSVDVSEIPDGLYIVGLMDGDKTLGVKKLSVLHR